MDNSNWIFYIERDGADALVVLLRALNKLIGIDVLLTELRDDSTSFVSLMVRDGALSGRLDIGLYPQKNGTKALFIDHDLSKFSIPTHDKRDVEEFQSYVAQRIRDEIEDLCFSDTEKSCTFQS